MACSCKTSIAEIFSCRRILYGMVVSCFMLNSGLKILFNITIVTMVKTSNDNNTDHVFDWNENQKQDILGLFFWGFALTKIPSGRLAEIIGSRKVTGFSMILCALLTLLTPFIAFWNYYILLTTRVLFGFVIGASWPAIMPLAAKWIPPNEHSVFIAGVASTGLGVAITFHLCGFLIATYGWQSVFYFFGSITLLWSLLWFYLIYDTPQQHPRISFHERLWIEKQIDQNIQTKKLRFKEVPWGEVIKSGPVWAIVAGQVATFFGYATLSNELPLYLTQVLHLNIKETGTFSGLPYWGGYFAALSSGFLADKLRKSQKLSITAIRKLFETISLTIPCICMIILAFWGDISPVAISIFTLTLTSNAISTSGHCANILDISPNFAGTICGIVNTISALTAYFSTKLVARLLQNGQSFQEWKYLFWIILAVYTVATIIYLVFCSGKLQPWDSLKKHKESEDKEMQLINDTNKI